MKTIIWQQSDVVVDREIESDKILKMIGENWDKKTIHYICSETAIGKTSLITKSNLKNMTKMIVISSE